MGSRCRAFISMVLDCLEAMGLALSLIFAIPMSLLRRLDRFYALSFYVRFMLPRGLIAPYARALVDYRLGNYEKAANLIDQMTTVVEDINREKMGVMVTRILCDFYCFLFKLHLLNGNIEDAAITVIRAKEELGLERLPTSLHFDAKVAQVVRAGIAAGKLLDEGGLATLLVRQGQDPEVKKSTDKPSLKNRRDGFKVKRNVKRDSGKVIPFPKS
ncbi:MAG: hypothetical protein HRU19_08995 [Pseudobacteriovorax sp.]|nr:hypothetical protein [Pseudobacteriovorax sp.]